jgi:hypothetical protein
VCAILGVTTFIKAEFKDDLKNRFAQTLEFVQSEKVTRSSKIGIGSITIIGGCFFLSKIISQENKTSRFNKVRAITFMIPAIISGCYMLNDGLNNTPNEYLKSLAQKAKMKLHLKVNEQK